MFCRNIEELEDTLGLGVIPLHQAGFLPGMDQVVKTTETLLNNGKENNWGKLTTAKWIAVGLTAELPVPEQPPEVDPAQQGFVSKPTNGEVYYIFTCSKYLQQLYEYLCTS